MLKFALRATLATFAGFVALVGVGVASELRKRQATETKE